MTDLPAQILVPVGLFHLRLTGLLTLGEESLVVIIEELTAQDVLIEAKKLSIHWLHAEASAGCVAEFVRCEQLEGKLHCHFSYDRLSV